MASNPITNPAQVTTATLAANWQQALQSTLDATVNQSILAAAKPGQTVTIYVASYTGCLAVILAGFNPTAAQVAAQVVGVSYTVPGSTPPPPPPYSLGTELAPGLYILNASGAFPAVGTTIQINGVNYIVGAIDEGFEYTAQLIQPVAA